MTCQNQYHEIPKPIKYASSDSSPFISDDSLSDDNSSQDDPIPSLSKPLVQSTTSNYNSTNRLLKKQFTYHNK